MTNLTHEETTGDVNSWHVVPHNQPWKLTYKHLVGQLESVRHSLLTMYKGNHQVPQAYVPENTGKTNTMPPIVITVLLLSVAAISPVSTKGNGKEEKDESVSGKIEKANAHVRPGLNLTYGDIMGDMIDDDGILRNAVPCTSSGCKWPKSGNEVIIPYEISGAFSRQQKRFIKSALSEFSNGERTTCVRFVKKRGKDINYLSFISDSGCWSYLGQIGGRQPISLQRNGCVFKDIVQHEVLHALGFHHEQVRSDRDDHVIIKFENIRSGTERNFQIANTNNLGTPYDFDSVMHYSPFAFSSNGDPTIVAIDSSITNFGTATEMSARDYDLVNRLYEC
ncbi:low choriolytic enzyme-like isoform X2 [Syngnathus typhle]|nr:low choriolytic enzyme-like isoform X2 [Syngnathus typhle]